MPANLRRFTSRAPNRPGLDVILIGAVLLLTLFGLLMAYSTTYFWSYSVDHNPLSIFLRQLTFAAIGLVLFGLVSQLDYGQLRRFALPAMLLCLLMLFAVFAFGGDEFGARRTLFSGSFQPSELMKIVIAVYGAAWLSSSRVNIQSFKDGLLPYGAILGAATFFIVLQPDLSTTLVVTLIALAMLFMANARMLHIGAVVLIALLVFVLLTWVFPHSSVRLEAFRDAFRDPAAAGNYHIRQLTLTMGGAGLFGHGIGASSQKFGILPTPHTDSVIAVLADEMGLVGLLFSFALFGVFAWRGLRIAARADTAFGALLATGITVWIVGQTLMNVLSVLSMIPFTGVPAPFLSVGGSSLVSVLFASGILLSIARGTQLREASHSAEPEIQSAARKHGVNGIHASTTVRRRNSGARAAGPHRVAGAAGSAASSGANNRILGKEVKLAGQLKTGIAARIGRGRKGGAQRRSPVRWRE